MVFSRENFSDDVDVVYLKDLKDIKKCSKSTKLDCGARYLVKNIHHDVLPIKKRDYLNNIIDQLMVEINKKTDLKFKLVEIDNVIEQLFSDGGTRYILDFFVHETNKYYNKRLILDILIINQTVHIRNLTIANSMHENIDSMESNNYEFDKKIIDDENLKFNNIIKGLNDTSLEFGRTNLKNSAQINRDFTKWIEPTKEEPLEEPWPCRKQGKWWDKNSIQDTEVPHEKCHGINSSLSKQNHVGHFRPDHKNRDINAKNGWAFSNYLQVGSSQSIMT